MLRCTNDCYSAVTPAIDAGLGDQGMRMFVIAVSALLAVATQALVVGAVVTTI